MNVKRNITEEVEVRPIPGFDTYYASADGEIYSSKSKRWLKPTVSSTGYRKVVLSLPDGRHTQRVNRLVALAWLGLPPSPDMVCDHIQENNKTYDSVENLQWLTQSENINKAFRENGRSKHVKYDRIVAIADGEIVKSYLTVKAACDDLNRSSRAIRYALSGN